LGPIFWGEDPEICSHDFTYHLAKLGIKLGILAFVDLPERRLAKKQNAAFEEGE